MNKSSDSFSIKRGSPYLLGAAKRSWVSLLEESRFVVVEEIRLNFCDYKNIRVKPLCFIRVSIQQSVPIDFFVSGVAEVGDFHVAGTNPGFARTGSFWSEIISDLPFFCFIGHF